MSRRDDLLKKIQEPMYLGDGLSASFDGYRFKLSMRQGGSICLAPWVVNNFDHFRKSKRDLLKELQDLGDAT